MKACSACRVIKPLEDFYWTTRRNGDRARHSKCKGCRKAQFTVWSKTERGKVVKRSGILRRSYGISEDEYQRWFTEHGGCCAVCEQPETRVVRGKQLKLAVDHCHSSGKLRKLLCSGCNVGLGSFRDDPLLLVKAAQYLLSQGQAAKTEAAEKAAAKS